MHYCERQNMVYLYLALIYNVSIDYYIIYYNYIIIILIIIIIIKRTTYAVSAHLTQV